MIATYSKNKVGRDLIIGDIHGCFSKVEAFLKGLDFDPEKDRLFSVGDLVDRGPESHMALEWIQYKWFFPVQGNHEDMAIRFGRPNCMMDAGNYAANGGAWNIANTDEQRREFSLAFEKLPVAIELETDDGLIVIIHASCPGNSWKLFKDSLLFEDISNKEMRQLRELALWDRSRVEGKVTTPIEDVRAVICGHTPLKKITVLGNVHHIDTAGWHPNGFGFSVIDAKTLQVAFGSPVSI